MAKLEEERFSQACPCGRGRVEWVFNSPTAPFQTGYHGPREIKCGECKRDWAFAPGGRVRLRRKEHVSAHESARRREREASETLRANVIQPVVAALNQRARASGRRAADWYEVLRQFVPDAVGSSLSEFNKRRGRDSLQAWLESVVPSTDLVSLAAALGLSAPVAEFVAAKREAEEVARDAWRLVEAAEVAL